jgi:glycosyltransferase involved in cell wall biosynthesis
MKTLLLIPARNEEQQIGSVLDRLAELYSELPVLVINDASQDSTREQILARPRTKLIDLPFRMGYGGALQTGYKYALRAGYDSVVQLDGDGQHDPDSVRDLLSHLESADLVVGSRFLNQNNRYRMPLVRRSGCQLLSWLARRLTGMKITDPTSGFQALNRKALSIAVQDHYPLDYPDVDVLILMHRYRLVVKEIPAIMYPASEKQGMHEGLQVWYYGVKMLLSVLIVMLRKP